MQVEQRSILLKAACCFPQPPGVKFSYGTAGFRDDASLLSSTIFRVGVLAALRSLKTKSTIGLMITASHNKVSDNGIKIADPNGGMLIQEWEPFANAMANADSIENFVVLISQFILKENIQLGENSSAKVLLGRDTRPSGLSLLEAAKQGICAIAGDVAIDMGILTTPQLHWIVRNKNRGVHASENEYFIQMADSFSCLVDLIPKEILQNAKDNQVIVDGANGVGGEKLEHLKKLLKVLEVEVRNSGKEGDGLLNDGVGADYVQKEKAIPSGFGPSDSMKRCASFDGDADRLVYFHISQFSANSIDLVDGDKILSLFTLFIQEQLQILSTIAAESNDDYQVTLGVVQTAYANGASTRYLKQLGVDVIFTSTGVKYLHEKASEYDIGIYFEANGHGTILFSDHFLFWLESRNKQLLSFYKGSEPHKACLRLLAVTKLINQAVGDALSGLLLVEAILLYKGWSIKQWSLLYQDLPSRQLKVKVADRNAVITTNAETMVKQPLGLQEIINIETAKYPEGRTFVRPSGTEDVVRVYAEASTQEEADILAQSVAQHVDRFLGFPRCY